MTTSVHTVHLKNSTNRLPPSD